MSDQIEEIKKKLDIVSVISRFLPLKKRGRNFWACCPFHGEKTPSFTVSQELQIFKCFGCGKSGDIFTFLQEYEKIDFREALEELAKQAGIVLETSAAISQADSQKKRLLTINTEVAKFYHYILTKHPLGKTALDYVLNRGITLSTISLFQIGYSPQNAMLLVNYLLKKGYKIPDLIATGTFGHSQYHQGQLYDRFQNRLTFPLMDYRERILGFSGRVLPGAKAETGKYINSPETQLYHKSQTVFGLNHSKDAIRKESAVIVVEGEFDLISPFQAGIQNIVAIKGTAFTQEQLQLLKRYTDTLVLALDSDFAGSNAAKKSIEMADALGFDIKVIYLGEQYKDPDEAVRADPQFLKDAIANAVPVWDFFIRSAIKNFGTDTVKGRKQILDTVLPSLTKIDNNVIKTDYLRKLAAQLATSEDAVIAEASKHLSGKPQSALTPIFNTNQTNIPINSSNKIEKLEEYLMALIFSAQKPNLLAVKLKDKITVLTLPKNKKYIEFLLRSDIWDLKSFVQSLPPELTDSFHTLYLTADGLNFDPPKRRHELKKTLNELTMISLKAKLKTLSARIAQLEDQNEFDQLKSVEKDYNLVLKDISKLQAQKG